MQVSRSTSKWGSDPQSCQVSLQQSFYLFVYGQVRHYTKTSKDQHYVKVYTLIYSVYSMSLNY